MITKLKIAAAGAVVAASMAMPGFAQPMSGGSSAQILPSAGMIEKAKLCRPHTLSIRRCIRGKQVLCRYRITVFCKRVFLGCRPSGPPCFVPR